jgi:hypothetical protein
MLSSRVLPFTVISSIWTTLRTCHLFFFLWYWGSNSGLHALYHLSHSGTLHATSGLGLNHSEFAKKSLGTSNIRHKGNSPHFHAICFKGFVSLVL